MAEKLIEVARSYSVKINTGNFENTDLFCSAKQEVPLKDADKTSQDLMEFCKSQVEADKLKLFPIEIPDDHEEVQPKLFFDAKKHADKLKEDIDGLANEDIDDMNPNLPSEKIQENFDEDSVS